MKQVKKKERINHLGKEVLDKTPVELPIGYKHPMSLPERMKIMIKEELSRAAEQSGYETWEEANDFNIPGESDDVLFKDEDEEVAVNDPNIERAYLEERRSTNSVSAIQRSDGSGFDKVPGTKSGDGNAKGEVS